jgi:hypothetical protein
MAHCDFSLIFWILMFVGVDVQSVHFPIVTGMKCHSGLKHPVDVPFGSKCSVDVPVVDVLSMEHILEL